MQSDNRHSYLVHFLVFVIALFIAFKIIEPLITILLTSILITYISYPMFKKIKGLLKNKFASILITIFIIALILLLPFSFITIKIAQQSYIFYNSLSINIAQGTVFGFTCNKEDSRTCMIIKKAEEFSATTLKEIKIEKHIESVLSGLLKITTNYLIRIPQAIIGTGLSLFISYFLFRDSENIMKSVMRWFPFRKKDVDKFVTQFKKITHTIVFSQILVALVQGVVGIIGFYIFGVPLAIFWGVVMAFFALLPTIGTALIWAPASLFLIISGYVTGDFSMMVKGIGLAVYGVLIISTIDNLLRIKIIHSKAEVHPIIVIIGVIGGINLFGMIGVFLGPMILSLLLTYFQTFKESFMGGAI